jgi:iron complex outermembrane receptor protein
MSRYRSLCGVSLLALSGSLAMVPSDLLAQAPAQTLPAVTVDAPKPTRAKPVASKRRVAQGSARRAPAPVAARTPDVNPTAQSAAADRPPVFAGGQVARGSRLGMLGNADTFRSPFATASYTSETIRNLQASTVADAVLLDPSVRVTSPVGGVADSFFIRGMPSFEGAAGEATFDGVYGIAPNFRMFNTYVDRIEIFKGPSAILSGLSPNGGTINIVPKRAEADLSRIGVGYVSKGFAETNIDLSRRFGDHREFGLRFNGKLGGGDTALDHQSDRLHVGSLALDYQGERYRSWIYALTQNERFQAPTRQFTISSGLAIPAAPDGRTNPNQSWEWARIKESSVLWKNELDLSDSVTLFGDIGGSKTNIERFFGLPNIFNAQGDTRNTPQYYNLDVDRFTYDGGVRARFDTGFVHHAVSVQASYYEDRQYRAFPAGQSYLSNIYNPIVQPEQGYTIPALRPRLADNTLKGVALADTMSVLDERVALTLGVRRQQVISHNFSPVTTLVTTSYDETATTPMAGLVVRPLENVSLYANYIESLTRGDIAPAIALNARDILPPYRTKQYETGIKLDFGRIGTTFGLFEILKPNGELNAGIFAAIGEQRVRGAEFSVFGEITPGLRAVGGLTLFDAAVTKTTTTGTLGKAPVGVPSAQFNLGGEWDLPGIPGVTLTSTLIYTGRQYVDALNTQVIPEWTRLDLGARYVNYVEGRKTTLRGTVQNVAGTNYWAGVASFGTFTMGTPRVFQLSLEVEL